MLKLENVSTYYGDVPALGGISLKVETGNIVSLLGSNGAGKSTTLHTISGIFRCSTGIIEFLGRRIQDIPPHRIVLLGLVQVPEGRRLFPYMSVLENLELGAFNTGARKELRQAMNTVFELFPVLAERKKQIAGTLSGGEQQMLAIGRGIMAGPRLLMLDEPSLGLAPRVVDQVFDTVKEINSRGISVLLVEQNVFQSLSVADQAYVLENGKIVLEGKGKEVLSHPQIREAYLGM